MNEPDLEDALAHVLAPTAVPARRGRHLRRVRSREDEAVRLGEAYRAFHQGPAPLELSIAYYPPTDQIIVKSGRHGDPPTNLVIADTLRDCLAFLLSGADDGGRPIVLDEDGDSVCPVCHGLGLKFDELEAGEAPTEGEKFVETPLGLRGVLNECPECEGTGEP